MGKDLTGTVAQSCI